MNRVEAIAWIENVCGSGWVPLIDEVYENLPTTITIQSVYQKWGALQFDCVPWDNEFEIFLEYIENKSLGICEVCGEFGTESNIRGWAHTRCELHNK